MFATECSKPANVNPPIHKNNTKYLPNGLSILRIPSVPIWINNPQKNDRINASYQSCPIFKFTIPCNSLNNKTLVSYAASLIRNPIIIQPRI